MSDYITSVAHIIKFEMFIYSVAVKMFGGGKILLTEATLIWLKYSKNSTILKYYYNIHYITKIIVSPTFNERFDYFSNFHEYKS